MQQAKILISACLLGDPVRYDAKSKPIKSSIIQTWIRENRLIKACPETLGGLATPRPAAEINNDIIVTTRSGVNLSHEFRLGADATLSVCLEHNISIAILAESSPSCGSSFIYDGSFQKKKIKGEGITTQLLRQHGILAFSQFELEDAQATLLALTSR